MIQDMCQRWKTKHIKSLSYRPKMNEAVELQQTKV